MVNSYVPYGRQAIDESDIAAVVEVLRSDWLTTGPKVAEFERFVADYCGAGYGMDVCNATAALHLACRTVGLGTGDLAWTSPNTLYLCCLGKLCALLRCGN